MKPAPLLFLFTGVCVSAVSEANLFAVLNYDPPQVLLIDAAQAKVLATIPVAEHPMKMLMGSSGDFLYVVHDGAGCRGDVRFPENLQTAWYPNAWKKPSSVSVVDLTARRVSKVLELSWNVMDVRLTDDGLFIIAAGVGRHANAKASRTERGMIHVIDTRSNEFVSRAPAGRDLTRMTATKDGSRVFSLAANDFGGPKWLWRRITPCDEIRLPRAGSVTLSILDPLQSPMPVNIPLPGIPSDLHLSDDDRWLYVLDYGWPDRNPKKNQEATVHVIDAEAAILKATYRVGTEVLDGVLDHRTGEFRVLSHRSFRDRTGVLFIFKSGELKCASETGPDPRMFWQNETFPQAIVVAKSEACLIDEDGTPQKPCIDLSPLELARSPYGYLKLEITYLPVRPALLFRSGKHGDQVMLADLVQTKTGSKFELGSNGARTSRLAGNTAANFGLGILWFLSEGRLNLPESESPWQLVPVQKRSDGKFAYVTNTYTNELTIIDIESGKAAASFPLGGKARSVSISPDGKWLGAFSKKKVLLIDVSTNETRIDFDPPSDPEAMLWSTDGTRFLALTEKALAVWSPEGQQVGVVTAFSKAIQILPRPVNP